MPRGDGTGPAGMGPMTGRAAGHCAGYATPGCANPVGGRGLGGRGRGGGGGRGHGNWRRATGLTGWQRADAGLPAFGGPAYQAPTQATAPVVNRELELQALKSQATDLKNTLGELGRRIEQLESAENG